LKKKSKTMDRPGLHSGPSLERIPLPVVLVDTTKVRLASFFIPLLNILFLSFLFDVRAT
jgi:hypothetical protein